MCHALRARKAGRPQEYTVEQVEAALRATFGNLTAAATALKFERGTLWLRRRYYEATGGAGHWILGDSSLTAIAHTINVGVPRPQKYGAPMPPMGGAQASPSE